MIDECPECGKRVSSMALSCPECGYPVSARLEADSHLRELMRGGTRERIKVARDPSTPEGFLKELARDTNTLVRLAVAGNRSAPEDLLRELARDKKTQVRAGVAQNLSVPEDLLRELARDYWSSVRSAVAKNLSAPQDLLRELLSDISCDVVWEAAISPSLLEATLQRMVEEDGSRGDCDLILFCEVIEDDRIEQSGFVVYLRNVGDGLKGADFVNKALGCGMKQALYYVLTDDPIAEGRLCEKEVFEKTKIMIAKLESAGIRIERKDPEFFLDD